MKQLKTCPHCGILDLQEHPFEECCANLANELDETSYERDDLRAERDALRTVYKAAAAYCGDRTVSNEHALIDAVGEIRALAVQL